MTKVKWNLFAEGECDESELPFVFKGGNTKTTLYIKRKCPACGEVVWIRHGFNVCDTCIP